MEDQDSNLLLHTKVQRNSKSFLTKATVVDHPKTCVKQYIKEFPIFFRMTDAD